MNMQAAGRVIAERVKKSVRHLCVVKSMQHCNNHCEVPCCTTCVMFSGASCNRLDTQKLASNDIDSVHVKKELIAEAEMSLWPRLSHCMSSVIIESRVTSTAPRSLNAVVPTQGYLLSKDSKLL